VRDTWYNPAAASGDPEAIQNRASVARLMTVKQTAKAQEMASERQMFRSLASDRRSFRPTLHISR
jgi:hypothetical protein